jgi:3-isopropylmalate/(R)-2-methylmalate dehydratase large subunit
MGKTMSEKILARASDKPNVKAGDIVWVKVDIAMMDDILGPRVQIADDLKSIRDEVWDPNKVVIISDHYTPPASVKQAEIVKFTREWAASHGVNNYFEFMGPCHQVMAEHGFVIPGTVVVGTDSHTCMGGAFGAFATGIGSTEMSGVLLTGEIWFKVPETILVTWEGDLPKGVMAKDISLKTIGTIGHAGATYKAIEYTGSTITSLPMDERLCITNMAVEMGAKVGLMVPDQKTFDYLLEYGILHRGKIFNSDPDAVFAQRFDFNTKELAPQISVPHEVDNVHSVTDIGPVKIHQAYIGSCTGGRYSDLEQAAAFLHGKRIAKGVRLLVSPASDQVWRKASRDGLLDILADAGATILCPTCGVCVGVHSGLLAGGENCISSTNRNFLGRMGSKDAGIYLASPLTVAVSALRGVVSDPREYMD